MKQGVDGVIGDDRLQAIIAELFQTPTATWLDGYIKDFFFLLNNFLPSTIYMFFKVPFLKKRITYNRKICFNTLKHCCGRESHNSKNSNTFQ